MKNRQLFFIFSIFLIALISSNIVNAVPPVTTIVSENYGYQLAVPLISYIPANTNRTFHVHVFNISNGVPITSKITCHFHLYNPQGNHIAELSTSTVEHDYDYEFPIPASNFTQLGIYQSIFQCDDDEQGNIGIGGFYKEAFAVTINGSPDKQSIYPLIAVIILFILIFFVFIFVTKEVMPFLAHFFFLMVFIFLTILSNIINSHVINNGLPYVAITLIIYRMMLIITALMMLIILVLTTIDAVKIRKIEGNPVDSYRDSLDHPGK